jgi:hypothetical protein
MQRLVRFHAGLSDILRPHVFRTSCATCIRGELVIGSSRPLGCVVLSLERLFAPEKALLYRYCLTRSFPTVKQDNSKSVRLRQGLLGESLGAPLLPFFPYILNL